MSVMAALLTPKGPGAIAVIKLCGPSASTILATVFEPSSKIPLPGKLVLGTVVDGSHTIDRVVVACESENSFAINCHGSPLVVELVMDLLCRHGASPVEAKVLLYSELRRDTSLNSIAVEAALTQLDSLTVEGAKLIARQLTTGLVPLANRWLSDSSGEMLSSAKSAAAQALARASVAHLIIHGARIVLAGPPNSGKSTLLNTLAGRPKSIVADSPGTTRDYISARFTIPSLAIELIDTAGLGEHKAMDNIALAAQKKSRDLLASADLIILVLDSTRPIAQFDASFLAGRPVVTVCNKSDIATLNVPGAISISAANGDNLAALVAAIRTRLGIDTFDLSAPAPFTPRQQDILQRLVSAPDHASAVILITELLNCPVKV
jgi:tRNA modification GTPase